MRGQHEDGATLARRVREIRVEQFGEAGVERLAGLLGIPPRTWLNYEAGVAMPALVLLRFLRVTGVAPDSLMPAGDRPDEDGGRPSRLDGWTPGPN